MTAVIRLALAAAFMLSASVLSGHAQSISDTQRGEIEKIVRDYLISHPEVLQEAISALEKRQAAEEAEKHEAAVKDNAETIFNSPRQVTVGNPQGDVGSVYLARESPVLGLFGAPVQLTRSSRRSFYAHGDGKRRARMRATIRGPVTVVDFHMPDHCDKPIRRQENNRDPDGDARHIEVARPLEDCAVVPHCLRQRDADRGRADEEGRRET